MENADTEKAPEKGAFGFPEGLTDEEIAEARKRIRRNAEDFFGLGRPPRPPASRLERLHDGVVRWAVRAAKTALLEYHQMMRAVERGYILDPNQGQSLKLGRYSFGLTYDLVIGTGSSIFMSDSPATTLRTKKIVTNVPCADFVWMSTILTANVCTNVGGVEDAYIYSPRSFVEVEYPTIPPSQKLTVSGSYTGRACRPFAKGEKFRFGVSFIGPSTLTGGY